MMVPEMMMSAYGRTSFTQTRCYSTAHDAKEFSHLDKDGKARMVDVSEKTPTKRTARAQATVQVGHVVFGMLRDLLDGQSNRLAKKGDFVTVTQLAGIMAAKQTSLLIPLCHPIGVHKCRPINASAFACPGGRTVGFRLKDGSY
jgi:hypothetical protein